MYIIMMFIRILQENNLTNNLTVIISEMDNVSSSEQEGSSQILQCVRLHEGAFGICGLGPPC